MPSRRHQFYAVAFEENFSLRQIAPAFPEARISPLELFVPIEAGGGCGLALRACERICGAWFARWER
jgi:hypothetical protein